MCALRPLVPVTPPVAGLLPEPGEWALGVFDGPTACTFHADALSPTVNLNVDLDIMPCVLAQALTAALRVRLPGYAHITPDVLQRRLLETPGQIITTDTTITVRLDRRAYAPVLRQANFPHDTPIPWWGNRTLRYEFS